MLHIACIGTSSCMGASTPSSAGAGLVCCLVYVNFNLSKEKRQVQLTIGVTCSAHSAAVINVEAVSWLMTGGCTCEHLITCTGDPLQQYQCCRTLHVLLYCSQVVASKTSSNALACRFKMLQPEPLPKSYNQLTTDCSAILGCAAAPRIRAVPKGATHHLKDGTAHHSMAGHWLGRCSHTQPS